MTEYGRGQSLPPWHPDDPLFGDREWDGGRDASYPGDGDPYGGQYADPYGSGQHQVPHQQGYYGQQGQQQYPGQGHGQGGYGSGQGVGSTDPHGMPVVDDPYNTGGQQGYYGAQQGYPQQQPQGQGYQEQYAQPGHGQGHGPDGYLPPHPGDHGGHGGHGGRPDADPETGWDPGPDQGEHAFFADREDSDARDDDFDDAEHTKRSRRDRGGETKRRSGCACLVVSLVLAGGLGTAGYYGYSFYQRYLAPAPDYSGKGSGQTQVKIPDGASIADMGDELKKAGVVKSAGAFVDAAQTEKKSSGIQPGTYSMRKQMSGASAVKLMLDPASQNGLIISEGLRAKAIYELVDEKLAKPKGTTQKAAKNARPSDLGLPRFAEGNPEGFLFPSRYSVGEQSDPVDVLRDMVGRAKAEHTKVDLAGEAKKIGQTPEEVLTIASLIQAEAQQDDEFGKVSRVIYNRLEQDMRLGFDSTINYAKGRSSLDTSVEDTKFKSPYNTYLNPDLPPAPIDNPGHQAIEAALNPTKGNWLYFVTVKPGDTRFTASKAEHDRNVQDFNREQRKQKGNGG